MNKRTFDTDERGGWYRFLSATCRTQHAAQIDYLECEQRAFVAWDALTEPGRERYREEYRAIAAA